MKIKINESRLKEIIAEEMAALEDKHHMHHVDNEGKMAKRQLEQLAEYAMELSIMLQDNTQLEGWVQSKITLAQDYISKVKHYLEDELGMSPEGCGAPAPDAVSDDVVFTIDDEDAYLMET
tara:strand:- start:1116 stop:1478 length:363 start_codon:yes stop_codon:yes gene_type:complete